MITINLFGQKWLAAQTLEALLLVGCVHIGCVCPDSPDDKLGSMAKAQGIPVIHNLSMLPPADVGIAAHCQRFLPQQARAICGLGVLAYHPSLLPRHRGRDSIHWTLAMGDAIAGGTVYWMQDKADDGPIAAQDWCHILPGETAAQLWRRALAPMGVRLLINCVKDLLAGNMPTRQPQDERVATWEPSLQRPRLSEIG